MKNILFIIIIIYIKLVFEIRKGVIKRYKLYFNNDASSCLS